MALQVTKRTKAVAIAMSLAMPAEGLYLVSYGDIANPKLLTVCYGSTNNVDPNKTYTKEECLDLLDEEMTDAIETVDRCVPNLPVHVLAAFGDAVYNMGPKIACNTKDSTAARMLKAGDYIGACMQLPRWNKANFAGVMLPLPGLTKRRNAEMNVCLHGLT